MQRKQEILLPDEQATYNFAAQITQQLTGREVIFLYGDLGAGKTSWVRGMLRSLGFTGSIKSPTYTIVEPYYIDNWKIYHFDLYRISHYDELELLGIRDYLTDDAICIFEWPEKIQQYLINPDVILEFQFTQNNSRTVVVHNFND